ncbi:MAG: hypothetical protein ACYDD4_02715 [Acidimicrobiales bacterium]
MARRGARRPEHHQVRLSHWRADGGAKTRYPNVESAERAALQYRLEHGTDLRSYECEFCGGWHLGGGSDSGR